MVAEPLSPGGPASVVVNFIEVKKGDPLVWGEVTARAYMSLRALERLVEQLADTARLLEDEKRDTN